jgi:shikimate kinase
MPLLTGLNYRFFSDINTIIADAIRLFLKAVFSMSKVLHEKITNTNKQAAVKQENNSEQLVTLMQEMKATWQEAASDLLQPRPEAVAQLLKKVLH